MFFEQPRVPSFRKNLFPWAQSLKALGQHGKNIKPSDFRNFRVGRYACSNYNFYTLNCNLIQKPKVKPIYKIALKTDSPVRWPNNFKCFRVIFSLKKKTIQFPLLLSLYFQQKKAPKLSICHLLTKRSARVFDFANRTNGFSNFKVIMR